jgi:ribosomal protein S18 acetylase RimI-like enzyme
MRGSGMTHAERILLSDLNYAEAMRDLTRRAGGTVLDEDGLLLYAAPHPLPVFANGAMRTAAACAPERILERAREFFGARRRGFSLIVRTHADADLRVLAEKEGLSVYGEAPGMVLDHPLAAAHAPDGVELREVTTDADAKSFAAVQGAAYGTYGMPPDVTPLMLASIDVLRAPHIATFMALVDGEAAAGAMVVVTHGVAGIYWVGTTPAARGRGLAELCTRAATNHGFELGARVAALQASTMGEPIYARMGYVEVTRYPIFVQGRQSRR